MNPYPQTRAICEPSLFFGRTAELRTIIECANQSRNLSIVGARRFGKTSLRNMAMHRKFQAEHGLHPKRLLVSPRFRSYTARDSADFFRTLWRTVVTTAQAAGYGIDHSLPTDELPLIKEQDLLGDVLNGLSKNGVTTCVLLDEADALFLGSGLSASDFSFLRQIADNDTGSYCANFVLFSRKPTQQISRQAEASPFFNVFGNALFLGNLDSAAARDLIRRPSDEAGGPLEGHSEPIIRCAGRQPLILQHACSIAFELVRDNRILDEEDLRQKLYFAVEGLLEDWWVTFHPGCRQALRALRSGRPTGSWAHELGRLRETGWLDLIDGSQSISPPVLALFVDQAFSNTEVAMDRPVMRDAGHDPASSERVREFKSAAEQLRTALHNTVSKVLQDYLGEREPWNLREANPALYYRLDAMKYFDATEDTQQFTGLDQLVEVAEAGWDLLGDYLTPSGQCSIRPVQFWKTRIHSIDGLLRILEGGIAPAGSELDYCIQKATELLEVLHDGVAPELNLPSYAEIGSVVDPVGTPQGRGRRTVQDKQAIVNCYRQTKEEIRQLASELNFNHELTISDLQNMRPTLKLWQISATDRLKPIFDKWRQDLNRNITVDISAIVNNIVLPLYGLTSFENIRKFTKELRKLK